MTSIGNFFKALWKELTNTFQQVSDYIIEIFEPQSGIMPKVIFGAIMLIVVFWVAKRGTKS